MYSIQANNILRCFLNLCYVCCLLLFFSFLLLSGGASLTTEVSFRSFFSQGVNLKLLSLTSFWIVGLFIGVCLAYFDTTFSFSLMLSAVQQPMSIVGLFACVFLPFLIFYSVCISGRYPVIWVIILLKAIGFSFSCVLIIKYFDSAAWMIAFLFQFSDVFSLILLFHAVVSDFVRSCKFRKYIYFVLLFMVAITDYCVIAPLLQQLF